VLDESGDQKKFKKIKTNLAIPETIMYTTLKKKFNHLFKKFTKSPKRLSFISKNFNKSNICE
jgi:uncharacterized protein YbbC (DUF1343 family)